MDPELQVELSRRVAELQRDFAVLGWSLDITVDVTRIEGPGDDFEIRR